MTMDPKDVRARSDSDPTRRSASCASRPPAAAEEHAAQLPLQFGDVRPSLQAQHELAWFFNDAERAIDEPSAFCALVAGHTASSTEEAERRHEAMHAAGTINRRLQGLGVADALMLSSLYTQRAFPARVTRVLQRLAGPVAASPTVRAHYLRALIAAQTQARSVEAWLEGLLEAGGPSAVEDWRREAQRACGLASHAYELARGTGPSVAPTEGA